MVLLLGAIVGYVQGAFKQIASFIGILVGVLLGYMLSKPMGASLSSIFKTQESFGVTMAFLLVAITVPLILAYVAKLLTKAINVVQLGVVNRIIGAGVGVLCYALLQSVAFNMMDFIDSDGGNNKAKLEKRPEVFYKMKHMAQFVMPDQLLVTDAYEELSGMEPKTGIVPMVDKATLNFEKQMIESTKQKTLKALQKRGVDVPPDVLEQLDPIYEALIHELLPQGEDVINSAK